MSEWGYAQQDPREQLALLHSFSIKKLQDGAEIDMHNRAVVDAAFTTAGTPVKPAIETNSILTMALSVVAGNVCSVMPGALVGTVRGYRELEALPLIGPELRTPIGFMLHGTAQASRALQAAMALAQDSTWLHHAAAHSGLLRE